MAEWLMNGVIVTSSGRRYSFVTRSTKSPQQRANQIYLATSSQRYEFYLEIGRKLEISKHYDPYIRSIYKIVLKK